MIDFTKLADYRPGTRPVGVDSLPAYLQRELGRIAAVITGLVEAVKALGANLAFSPPFSGWAAPNDPPSETTTYWGPKMTGGFVVENPDGGRFFELEVANTANGAPSVAGTIWAGAGDWSEYWGLGAVNPTSGRYQLTGTRAFEFDSAPYAGTARLMVENTQPAIADDASGAANEATVNAILAALRAHNIIEP